MIEGDIRNGANESFKHLISGSHVVKSGQRDRIGHAGVVRVERDDISNAHIDEFLQGERAVERLTPRTLVLATLVEHRHNDRDPVCFALDRPDDPFEILIVVVGTHRHGLTVHIVGHAVVEHIADDEEILASARLLDHSLAFAAAETRAGRFDQERRVAVVASPILEIGVHLRDKVLTTAHPDHAEFADKRFPHFSHPP